ncbi:MAG: helix-turn-helix domain-containing protein [bacterium]|nr:MAG: helix-turn-helix domain-containing protein [bacterium]
MKQPSNIKNDWFTALSLFLVFWTSTATALDPSRNFSDYLQKNWSRESGLPQNTIFALVQDHHNFLWIGTPSGLVRFDGINFKIYNRQNTPVLKNDCITTLHLDSEKRLWIGTEGGGAYFLQDGEWTSLSSKEGLSHDYVRAIISDTEGNVWIGTDYGLNRYGPEGIQRYITDQGLTDNTIRALSLDKQGFLWIGTHRGGLMQFMNGIVRIYNHRQDLPPGPILSLFTDQRNQIWIGTMQGLYFLQGGRVRYISETAEAPITSIIEDSRGTLWVGTMTDGLWRLHEGELSGQGDNSRYIHTLLMDSHNNLWMGTDAAGLFLLKNRNIDNITRKNGLPEGPVNAVLQDRQGDLWIGMMDGGVYRLRNSHTIQILGEESGLLSDRITSLFEDSNGDLWIGTADKGLNILRGKKLIHITQREGLTSDFITSIAEDPEGKIWVGTDRGLTELENGKDPRIISTSLITHHIRTIYTGDKSALFIGSKSGLFTYNGTSFDTTKYQGRLKQLDILSIHQEAPDKLWLGTNGDGLYCIQENGILSWSTEQGLPDNHIFSIVTDAQGDLWMSSYTGVFRIPIKELNSDRYDQTPFPIFAIFDEGDGMTSSRCSASGKPANWKSNDGNIYYATAGGVAIFEPELFTRVPEQFPIYVDSFLADGQPMALRESIILSYPVHHLTISFSCANYTSPAWTRIYHKLSGHDSSWVQSTSPLAREISYLNLPPGQFQLHITAISHRGDVGKRTIQFEISSPFHHSTIFWAMIIVISLGGTGLVYYRIQFNRVRKKQDKYKTSSLDPHKAAEIVPRLLQLMEQDKLYLNPNLSLKIIAKEIRIHPNHLSRIINEKFGMNYNDFINRYRIQEAQELLRNNEGGGKNILEIMYDCGFFSKSVFNTAFKKFSGMTPSEYKRHQS